MQALADALARPQRAPRRRALPARADRHVRAAGGDAAASSPAPRRCATRWRRRTRTPSAAEFLADLRTIATSLSPHHAQALVAPRLRAADARGAGVRLPPRHASTCGRAPTSTRRWSPSCCASARIEPDYAALDEAGAARAAAGAARTTRGRCACRRRRLLRAGASASWRSSRRRARAARALRRARRIRHYIISHTEDGERPARSAAAAEGSRPAARHAAAPRAARRRRPT